MNKPLTRLVEDFTANLAQANSCLARMRNDYFNELTDDQAIIQAMNDLMAVNRQILGKFKFY